MINVMNDQNELVTKGFLRDALRNGMDQLEARITANTDAKIDALTLMTQQEFVEVRREMRGMDERLVRVEQTMATKQDLFRVEARILDAIGDIVAEVKNHNRRILALGQIAKS